MSGERPVLVERSGPVTTVIINRPELRNAVDGRTSAALAEAFRAFERDDAASVAVLTGAGDSFCAGADLKAIGGPGANRVAADGDGPMGPTRMQLAKPVIAAVEGYAVAGGLELALWCDLRVASATAVFGVYCRRWGVPLIDGGTVRLPRLVGSGRALEMILTGRSVDATEALAWGLVNSVVAAGCARAAAESLAHELAFLPQRCLLSDRRSAIEQWGLEEGPALANEFAHGVGSLRESADGVARFVQGEGRHGGSEQRPKPRS